MGWGSFFKAVATGGLSELADKVNESNSSNFFAKAGRALLGPISSDEAYKSILTGGGSDVYDAITGRRGGTSLVDRLNTAIDPGGIIQGTTRSLGEEITPPELRQLGPTLGPLIGGIMYGAGGAAAGSKIGGDIAGQDNDESAKNAIIAALGAAVASWLGGGGSGGGAGDAGASAGGSMAGSAESAGGSVGGSMADAAASAGASAGQRTSEGFIQGAGGSIGSASGAAAGQRTATGFEQGTEPQSSGRIVDQLSNASIRNTTTGLARTGLDKAFPEDQQPMSGWVNNFNATQPYIDADQGIKSQYSTADLMKRIANYNAATGANPRFGNFRR